MVEYTLKDKLIQVGRKMLYYIVVCFIIIGELLLRG